MIQQDKQKNAFYCIHMIFVWIRQLSAQEISRQDLIWITDLAERLPWFMASPENATQDFRSYLVALSERYTWGRGILEKFDGPNVEPW
jgi:hypothetical protein